MSLIVVYLLKSRKETILSKNKYRKYTLWFIKNLKYDGAEVHYAYGNNHFARGLYDTTGWPEKFVNGGINDYATSKTELANLRDYLGFCATGLAGNGAGYGALIGGVIGAVVGTIIGAGVLAKRCEQGQSDIKSMINKGRSNERSAYDFISRISYL